MYATLDEFIEVVPQLAERSEEHGAMAATLERATAIVNLALGFEFSAYGDEEATKDVRCYGGAYLDLPHHEADSVETVLEVTGRGATYESTEAITDYIEEADGRLYRYEGWGDGWYRVTAIWGYGPAPESIVQVTLEVAVNLWQGRQAGLFSDIVGVEGGGAVGYRRALTNQQRMIIDQVRVAYLGPVFA